MASPQVSLPHHQLFPDKPHPQALVLFLRSLCSQVPAVSDHLPPGPHFRTCPSPCPSHSSLKVPPQVLAPSGYATPHTLAMPLCRLHPGSSSGHAPYHALATPPVDAAVQAPALSRQAPPHTLATPLCRCFRPISRPPPSPCCFRARPQALATPPVNAAYYRSLPTLATPLCRLHPRSLLFPDTPLRHWPRPRCYL